MIILTIVKFVFENLDYPGVFSSFWIPGLVGHEGWPQTEDDDLFCVATPAATPYGPPTTILPLFPTAPLDH